MLNKLTVRYIVGIALFLLVSMGLLLFLYAQLLPVSGSPSAKQGVLELEDWDLEAQGQVYLDGEWEFYRSALLDPDDFLLNEEKEIAYLTVPESWKGSLLGSEMDRQGYGTYRLILQLNPDEKVYGLKISNIRMSHRLYINGQLEGVSGSPAESAALYKPGNTPYTVFFASDRHEVEIILQVSNYHFTTGGIVTRISFGLYEDINQQNVLEVGTSIGMVMLLLVFGMYHLFLFWLGRRETTYLLVGLFLMVSVVLQLLFEEKILLRMMPDIPFILAYKTIELTIFLSLILFAMLLCSINKRLMTRRILYLTLSPDILYVASILVTPYQWHMDFRYYFFVPIGVLITYLIVKSILLIPWRSDDQPTRIEALLFLGAILSILVYVVSGMMYAENTITTNLAEKFGMLAFILFMNLLLTYRFTTAYAKNEKLARQLQISNELKEEFLTYTAHELKTPLHGILNAASFMLEESANSLPKEHIRHLHLIKDTSTRLSMLIRDLVDVTHLKHNELRLQITAVDIHVAAQMVMDLLRFELGDKPVKLLNELAPSIRVQGDENRIRQVLYNLVHNAIKHTQEGTIKVASIQRDGMTDIIVEDTGSGIPERDHDRIFDYFERLEHEPLNESYIGMGVGLYISRQLVNRMEGDIGVESSEPGRGTRIRFSLPQASTAYSRDEAVAASRSMPHRLPYEKPLDVIDTYTHTILIVDDEASNIQVLHHLLSQRYNVVIAYSAREAMDKLQAHGRIDLVILDVMMPETSGIDMCKALRIQHSILELPVLLATVKDARQDVVMGFDAGANDYITKPFEGNTLLARIHTLISMKTSLQEALRNEFAFYQAQIKPHFLYNALSSVMSFCYTDGEKAAFLLSKLSHYLRYLLELDRSAQQVPLHRELELISAYVEIEKVRFQNRFELECHMEDRLRHALVPSLCIQPFVENAIRHGLFKKQSGGVIRLTITTQEQCLAITIQDNGIGMAHHEVDRLLQDEESERGIGVSNVRKRLRTIAGSKLDIQSAPGEGTTVIIHLPK